MALPYSPGGAAAGKHPAVVSLPTALGGGITNQSDPGAGRWAGRSPSSYALLTMLSSCILLCPCCIVVCQLQLPPSPVRGSTRGRAQFDQIALNPVLAALMEAAKADAAAEMRRWSKADNSRPRTSRSESRQTEGT